MTDSVPAAPTELAAYLRSGWGVILAFTDNSVDEEEFVAEISVVHDDGSTGPPVVIDRVPGSAPGETGGRFFAEFTWPIGAIDCRVRASNAAGVSEPTNEVRVLPRQLNYRSLGAAFFNEPFFAGAPILPDNQQIGWDADDQWGTASPTAGVEPGTFSAVFEGVLRADFSETYTFFTSSADGIAVTVMDPDTNRVVLDFDNLRAERELPARWSDFQDVAGTAALEADKWYFVRIRYNENSSPAGFRVAWSSFSTRLEPLPAEWMRPLIPGGPKVFGVYASGSSWAPSFRERMRTWDSRWQRGFRLGLGEPAAERLVPLPWTNLDQVTVQFDRAVTVGKDDLVLRGTRGGEYRPVSVVSDSSGFLATWTFDRPFEADRYEMTLDDGLTGAADGGQHLDGEWPGALNYSSGDGVSGGDFRLDFNVLPGDVNRDGRVLADDFSAVKRKFFTTPANPGSGAGIYTVFHDVDGSGGILADDFSEVKRRFFTTLPARGMAASAGAATLLREQPSRRRLFGNEPVFG